jgi:hypothetical protein
MRTFLSFVLAISGIVGAASPALAAKAPASLKVSKKSAIQGSKVTITMTANKFKTKRWYVEVKVNGEWQSVCNGKPKKGKIKCAVVLPLEGNNVFRAECFWCTKNLDTVYSSKATIKGKPASGSPKNPAAFGKNLALGNEDNKVGVLRVNSVNWNATSDYCKKFTNGDVEYEDAVGPCKVSSEDPGYFEDGRDDWEQKPSVANKAFSGKLVAVKMTYKQTKGGSGYIPEFELRQSDGSYVSLKVFHPGFEVPSGFYETSEATIQGVAVTRTAYFEVAKRVNSGHVVVKDYGFGEFPTRGLYSEAWLKTK